MRQATMWLAICAGLLLNRLIGLSRKEALAWLYALAVIALLVYVQARHYLLVSPDSIAVFRYGHRMAWARDQGRRVRVVTDSEDTVYCYGSDPGIYYYSGRRCATRFTMIEPVSAEREGVQERRVLFMSDFLKNRPRVVLITEEPFPELYTYLLESYRPAGMDFGAGPDQPPRMQVLMDPARPIRLIDWDWHPQ